MSHEHSNLPPSEMTATNATWRDPCTTNCPPWAHDHAAHPERTCWCPACTDGETDPYAKVAELQAKVARLQRERDEAQEAWASEAAAHAKATEIIYEQEEEELQLQAAYEAQLAEMRAALDAHHEGFIPPLRCVACSRAALAITPDRETV